MLQLIIIDAANDVALIIGSIDARLNQCLLEFESVSKLINFTSPNDLLIAKLAQ